VAPRKLMRWYNPQLGAFEWREVPKTDEQAGRWPGKRLESRKSPSGTSFSARCAAVFFGGPPYLLGNGVVGEAGHHRSVLTTQDDHTRIADQV
jgi:hypothetical protein